MPGCGSVSLEILCAVVLAAACSAEDRPNTLTGEEKAEGWELLFDGQTMNGWDDPRLKTPPGDAWSIEDGCLKATAHPRLTEDLFTNETFADFELAFEWRIAPAGNSGVKYRIQHHLFLAPRDAGAPRETFEQAVERSYDHPVQDRPSHGQDYVIGFEYQITDDAANRDARSNPKHTAGALYDMVAPSAAPARPAGEFNQSRILVRGNHAEHWMNGVKLVDAALDSPEAFQAIQKRWGTAPHVYELLATQPKKECPISLQNHGNEAWFRNIRIRRLKGQ